MSKKIMTVDDSSSIRAMVRMTLESVGYDVEEAEDGVDALEKLNNNTIDMMISDLNMPRMNGLELCRQVRALESHKFIPIIMLTTESIASTKLEGKEAGATGWIVKPFRQEQLLKVIQRVLA